MFGSLWCKHYGAEREVAAHHLLTQGWRDKLMTMWWSGMRGTIISENGGQMESGTRNQVFMAEFAPKV